MGEFPTVSYPESRSRGSIPGTEASGGTKWDADVVLATDPDADCSGLPTQKRHQDRQFIETFNWKYVRLFTCRLVNYHSAKASGW